MDRQGGKGRAHGPDIGENAIVGNAGSVAMLFAVHAFDVNEQIVQQFGGAEHGFLGHEGAGFQSAVDAALPGFAQQGKGKFGLGQRFASAQGHAAAGTGVKDAVLFHVVQDVLHRAARAVHGERLGGACAGTELIHAATGPVDVHAFGRKSQGVFRTDADAGSAGKALVAVVAEFLFHALGFGVAAPPAAQGTALEEDDGADARTVVDGIFLDIEDKAGGVGV